MQRDEIQRYSNRDEAYSNVTLIRKILKWTLKRKILNKDVIFNMINLTIT
jgi:hypothetical protein